MMERMSMKVFASIYIGSNAISLKVFEIVKGKRLKMIDHVRSSIDILGDIHMHGRIQPENLRQMIKVLKDFTDTAHMYRADEVQLCSGGSLSEAENLFFVIDQIRIQTGLKLEIMDNATQRYLVYEAVSSLPDFQSMIEGRSVMVDIGGSIIQLSLFSDGKVINSEHIRLGAKRVADNIRQLDKNADYREQMLEMLYKEIDVFYNMFLKQVPPTKLLIVHNQLMDAPRSKAAKKDDRYNAKEFLKFIKQVTKDYYYNVSGDSEANFDDLRLSYLLLYQALMERIPVGEVYVPYVSIHEGIAYRYAYGNRLLTPIRDIEEDILSQSWAIAERYNSFQPHLKVLEKLCMMIFDAMKKRHGLRLRDRLLLRVCAILHDCGKYISIAEAAQCTYTIITTSEILGLTEKERRMVASVTYFHRKPFLPYEEMRDEYSEAEYFSIIKLTAMLRVANALDKSHKQKTKNVKITMNQKDELVITVNAEDSLTLERGLFDDKAQAFIDAFGVKPIIREKRIL